MSRAGFTAMRHYRTEDDFQERTFFRWMSNCNFSHLTGGRFTGGKPDGFHPAFLLEVIAPRAYRMCPCTSKVNPKASYIRRGARTEPMGEQIDRDSYILHFYSFNLTYGDVHLRKVEIVGEVDDSDINGDFYKRGRSK